MRLTLKCPCCGFTCNFYGMRRPDKTEFEFFLLMALLLVPFAYFAIRTMLALLGA